ncbi:hypothetical protein JW968_05325 [Candidatus Woesearchaeota archaeon]|nr:hypothetical protein [Candidatus Woesearchaeota archaeon]
MGIRMLADRKGQEVFDMWLQVFRLIFTIFAVISVMVIIGFFVIKNINTQAAESDILVNRMLYSKTGISLYDGSIDRVYPGIVVKNSLDDYKINRSLNPGRNQLIAAKVTLYDDIGAELKSAYFNRLWYDRWSPMADLRVPGKGGITEHREKRYILYMDESGMHDGRIVFSVLTPNAQ